MMAVGEVSVKKVNVSRKKKITRRRVFVNCLVGLVYFVAWGFFMVMAVNLSEKKEEIAEIKVGVPVMEIWLDDVTLEEVHENGKGIEYDNNRMVLDGNEFDSVKFKGRGNFSWAADKKSYRIKFDSKVDLLGIGRARKWALITNGFDESLLRNDLAQHLMGMIVDEYPIKGEFVELVINEEYQGVYYLTRVIDINKQIVNLQDSMGVLVELDNAYCQGEEKWYETSEGNCLTLKSAVVDDNAEIAMGSFLEDFNRLEIAAEKGDYEIAAEVADMESLAEYFMISELTANPDAYVTSWFLYRDGEGDKIHASLAWDFDASFGNRKWGWWPEGFYSPESTMSRMKYTFEIDKESEASFCNYSNNLIVQDTVKVSRTICKLMNRTRFRELVGKVYREKLMGRQNEVIDYIDSRYEEIKEAAERDSERWSKDDFEEEVEYLKWWIKERMEFFEEKYVNHLVMMGPSSES